MRHRVKRRIRRRAAPKVRRCACNVARAEARERMAGAGGLIIGGAKDPAEAKADARATRALATVPTVHRKCAGCEADETAQRSPAAGVIAPGASSSPAPKTAQKAVNALGPGRPLSAPDRAFYEPRLNADLSAVRLHENAAADTAARTMDAQAFTLGTDIAFAKGERAKGGTRLMAHELAHAAEGDGEVRRTIAPSSHCHSHPTISSNQQAMDLISDAENRATNYCRETAEALRQAADNIDCGGGSAFRAFTAYRRWVGMPRRLPGAQPRYHSRFGGVFNEIQDAAAHEMRRLARKFDRLAARFGRNIIYSCPGAANYRAPGDCRAERCDTEYASSCMGSSGIVLCDTFWSELSTPTERAGTLIHELVHAFLAEDDHAESHQLRHRTPECLAQLAMEVVGGYFPQVEQCRPVPHGAVGGPQTPFFLRSMNCGGGGNQPP